MTLGKKLRLRCSVLPSSEPFLLPEGGDAEKVGELVERVGYT